MRPGAGHAVRTGYPDDDDEEESTTVDGLLDLVRWEEHVCSVRIYFYTCLVTISRSIRFLVQSIQSTVESKMTYINLESHLSMFYPKENGSLCQDFFKVTQSSHHVFDKVAFHVCISWFMFIVYRNMLPQNLIQACFQHVCFSFGHTTVHSTHFLAYHLIYKM